VDEKVAKKKIYLGVVISLKNLKIFGSVAQLDRATASKGASNQK
jgi:hypothetical protein